MEQKRRIPAIVFRYFEEVCRSASFQEGKIRAYFIRLPTEA